MLLIDFWMGQIQNNKKTFKTIQNLSDISFDIYLREASSFWTWLCLG